MADERTSDVNLNVNEEIQDRTIRHMVFLERYKGSRVRRIQSILNNEILPRIEERLRKRIERIVERGSDTGAVTTRRLQQLERELATLSKRLSTDVMAAVNEETVALTANEIEWQINAIEDSLKFDLELVVPTASAVANVTKRTSFAGLRLDQWFQTLERAIQRNVMVAVNRGVVEGETTDQIMRRIRGTRARNFTDGVFATTRRQAEALTRTTINHTSNQARIELFKANSDILHGLQWTATLDSRTSTICAGLDGKVFPVDKGQRPPAHVNCRSTMSPVLKSWRSLGLNDLDADTRASINGAEPSSITYGQWLKRQSVEIQEEVLGKTKARLFRDGNLPIQRFTDSRLNTLTLDELRAKEKKTFERLNL